MEQLKGPPTPLRSYIGPDFDRTLRYVAFPDLEAMRRSSLSGGIAALAGREIQNILH